MSGSICCFYYGIIKSGFICIVRSDEECPVGLYDQMKTIYGKTVRCKYATVEDIDSSYEVIRNQYIPHLHCGYLYERTPGDFLSDIKIYLNKKRIGTLKD